jgi:hypothetical protein
MLSSMLAAASVSAILILVTKHWFWCVVVLGKNEVTQSLWTSIGMASSMRLLQPGCCCWCSTSSRVQCDQKFLVYGHQQPIDPQLLFSPGACGACVRWEFDDAPPLTGCRRALPVGSSYLRYCSITGARSYAYRYMYSTSCLVR